MLDNILHRDIINIIIGYTLHPNDYLSQLLVSKLWNVVGINLSSLMKSRFIVQRSKISLGGINIEEYSIILPSGKKHGEYKTYWDNILRAHHIYRYGVRHGQFKYYDSESNLICECHYVNDKLNGLYKEYDEYGVILSECEYLNGYRHGKCQYWCINNDNKRIWRKCYYENDEMSGIYSDYTRPSGILLNKTYVTQLTYLPNQSLVVVAKKLTRNQLRRIRCKANKKPLVKN